MNRRGYSTQVKCTACHAAVECPSCSITMKYHSANDRLVCHYCGYIAPVPRTCPACGALLDREVNAAKNIKLEGLAQFLPTASPA